MSEPRTAQTLTPVFGLVIVAAGRGARSGLESGPKQFHRLAGRALIDHTLGAFQDTVRPTQICVVIHADDEDLLAQALGERLAGIIVAHGGATRQASVRNGLEALASHAPAISHVMIHDAARPFVSAPLLARIAATVQAHTDAGVLPALPIAETIKRTDASGLVKATVPREGLQTAQTPQTFPLPAIVDAHRRAAQQGRDDFTDDAALYEWLGLPVITVEGDKANFKLTYRRDFAMAEERLADTERAARPALPDVRCGNGYDVHRFGPGDHVMLCGVAIPHDHSLSGHSDADVGLHALTDALLATCGAGDIGDHFPPTDPQWKGQASALFVEHATQCVRQAGGAIMNADISIIAEAPKIAPHRVQMRERLSELLGIDVERCSVKATTNEKMGFVGRNEGIAAIATATVVYGPRD